MREKMKRGNVGGKKGRGIRGGKTVFAEESGRGMWEEGGGALAG